MRKISVLDDLRLRFPSRGTEFDDGLELGVLATLMALGEPFITRTVAPATLQQLRPIAAHLRYRVLDEANGALVTVTLEAAHRRPKLRLVR